MMQPWSSYRSLIQLLRCFCLYKRVPFCRAGQRNLTRIHKSAIVCPPIEKGQIMVTRRIIIALVLLLIVVGLILYLTQVNSHHGTSCCQIVLPIMLLLSVYFLLYGFSPQISIVATAIIGPLWKPPRLA
jgi:hypothetical protein